MNQGQRFLVCFLLALGLGFAVIFTTDAIAGTNQVEGVATVGSSVTGVKPVLSGVSDGTLVRAAAGDTNGNAYIDLRSGTTALTTTNGVKTQGAAADGAAVAGNPLLLGAKNGSGNVATLGAATNGNASSTLPMLMVGAWDSTGAARPLPVQSVGVGTTAPFALMVGGRDGAGVPQVAAIETSTNALHTTNGINAVLDTITPSGVKTSNGTTLVTIVSGVAGKRVLVGKLSVTNTSTTTLHTVDLVDQNASSVSLHEWIVPASGTLILDDTGITQTTGAGSLQFKIDSGGSGTDVKVTCLYVLK